MMRVASRTHLGMVRQENQDAVRVDPQNGIFIVADGMGGEMHGAEASDIAVREIHHALSGHTGQLSTSPERQGEAQRIMRDAFEAAHRGIVDFTKAHGISEKMGTTATVLWTGHGQGLLGHVGDSRLLLDRGEGLIRVSKDHTVAQELVDMGRISEEEAESSRYAHILSRVLGTGNKWQPDVEWISLHKGDTLLICSDGLSNPVGSERISRILSDEASTEDRADALLEKALQAGGPDNISLVLLDIQESMGPR